MVIQQLYEISDYKLMQWSYAGLFVFSSCSVGFFSSPSLFLASAKWSLYP